MPHIEDVLFHALGQDGDQYRFGAALDFADPDPQEFDCSGLVAWACARAGVEPTLPHSAFMQAQICTRAEVMLSVADGVATRGALLFKLPNVTDVLALTSRPEGAHVAWSLGNGTTIEAASTKWGVGSFTSDPARRDWTHAAFLPGVVYDTKARLQPATTRSDEEDEMTQVAYFRGASEGEVHIYAICGAIAKHLSPEALGLHRFFKTAEVGSIEHPLGKEWQDGVAIVDGPLQNVGRFV